MNEILNKLLLVGDKFVPVMPLRQPRLTYSVCVSFTKNKEIIRKFVETENSRYIYQNKLDKHVFNMT